MVVPLDEGNITLFAVSSPLVHLKPYIELVISLAISKQVKSAKLPFSSLYVLFRVLL